MLQPLSLSVQHHVNLRAPKSLLETQGSGHVHIHVPTEAMCTLSCQASFQTQGMHGENRARQSHPWGF